MAARAIAAAGKPAKTPSARATKSAWPFRPAGMTARLVKSPAGSRSSSRARSTRRQHQSVSARVNMKEIQQRTAAGERRGYSLRKIKDRVAKQPQSIPFGREPFACPARMLRRQHMTFRMRHHAEYLPACVADARHVPLRPIRVHGIGVRVSLGIDVAENDLTCLLQPFEDP